jgi:hypothetical protein
MPFAVVAVLGVLVALVVVFCALLALRRWI